MSNLNLVSIQISLGIFLERFSKIREIVQIEAKDAGLGKKTLKTNQMKKELNNLTEKIKERIKKYINNDDVTYTREVLLKLICIEKRNVVRSKSVKGRGDRRQPILICGQKTAL